MQKNLFCLFAVLFIFGSCAMVDFPEKDSRLLTAEKEMSFSAEFITSSTDSTAVISVVSNRSWYAVLNDLDSPIDPSDSTATVDWGELDICGHTNIEHITDTVFLRLTVYRNFTQAPLNGIIDFYSEGGKRASVKINQLPAVYHLEAVADRQTVECKVDSVKVTVNCNTAWSAKILESTAEVSLSDTVGFDPTDIYVKFGENIDVASKKYSKVLFKAKDCPDRIIEITQNEAQPYVEWSPSTKSKLNAWESSGKLVFKTNCAWTIEANDSTLTDIVFDKVSGGAGVKGDQEVSFSFVNTLTNPKMPAAAKITLKTDYTEPLTLIVTQRPRLVIDLSKNNFSPALPGSSSAAETSHEFTYQGESYALSIFLMRFITNKLYFVSGNDTGFGYIKFPVISDATLRGIEIFIKGQSTYFKITAAVFDNEGNQISNQYSFATSAQSTTHNFILGENGVQPESDKQYMLKGLAKQTCCINKIVLSYE